jgi:hypothetical protein
VKPNVVNRAENPKRKRKERERAQRRKDVYVAQADQRTVARPKGNSLRISFANFASFALSR